MNSPYPLFIKTIQQKIPKNVSLIEAIANVLNINYDAAYRRVNGKTSISLDEALLLSKHYKVSLDLLNDPNNNTASNIIMNPHINSEESLKDHFLNASNYLNELNIEDTSLIAAYKDIPTYCFAMSSLGRKFILYISESLFSENATSISFKDYNPSYNLLEAISSYRNSVLKVHTKEIWNSNTINSTIYRLLYFFKTELITKEDALEICEMLKIMIQKMDVKASNGYTLVPQKVTFDLYYNDLFTMDNSILFSHKKNKTYLFPYAPLSYYRIENVEMCKVIEIFFNRQIKYSKLLSVTGKIDRKKFINSMLSKIENTYVKIEKNTALIM